MFVAQVGESWEAGGDLGMELLLYDTSKEEDIVLQGESAVGDGHVHSHFLINLCRDSSLFIYFRIYKFCFFGTGLSVFLLSRIFQGEQLMNLCFIVRIPIRFK
jgi:hypothetical protein